MHTHGNTRIHGIITRKNDFTIIETVNISAIGVLDRLNALKEKYKTTHSSISSIDNAYELILFLC